MKEMQWGEPLYSDDVKEFGAEQYHKLKLESFEGAAALKVCVLNEFYFLCIESAACFGWI